MTSIGQAGLCGRKIRSLVRNFDVFDVASPVLRTAYMLAFALAVGSQRIIVAVEQQGSAGHGSRIHAHSLVRIRFDHHKAFPIAAVPFHLRFQALRKLLLNFSMSLTCMLIITASEAAI